MGSNTIVDAAPVAAPTSVKNQEKTRVSGLRNGNKLTYKNLLPINADASVSLLVVLHMKLGEDEFPIRVIISLQCIPMSSRCDGLFGVFLRLPKTCFVYFVKYILKSAAR